VRLLGLISLAILVACHSNSSVGDVGSPSHYVFRSGEDALTVLQKSPDLAGRCGTLPHALGSPQPGSTGQLSCMHMTVRPSNQKWLLNLWTYSDDFYAEAGYRKSCAEIPRTKTDGWWLIYQPGQTWFAEVSSDADIGRPTPPEFVAEKVANVLLSTAWNDCGAVKSSN
jgi:hypothetical protein